MPTEILISSDPWENRVAILENGSLAEVYIEREEKVIGSIYKGKVQNIIPGMGASFVDIGIGRNAFLYVDDINKAPLNIGDVEITQTRPGWTISEKVNRGDDVLIQIVKEPRGLKGARVSTNISLPGRYLILMPTGKFSGVSRKIESAEERNRLKGVMKRIRPDGMATIVRTAAAGVSDAELIADLGVLIRMWHGILENYKSSPSPSLIHKDMNLVFKAARDFITPEVERVLVDDAVECEKLRDFMRLLGPQYVDRISYYQHGRSLFADYKIDEELTRLMRPKVNLPSGGSIVIESTEALTVIDVNSGKYAGGKTQEDSIVHTNLEAAAEIARQVRLRDIGGIIVCDFIDMSHENSRTKVLATIEAGLRRDRTRTTLQSFSALGLLEFTRKRVGKDLSAQLRAACPTCRGLGSVLSPETVAIGTFRTIRDVCHSSPAQTPLEVQTPPTVGAQMRFWYEDELHTLEQENKRSIVLGIKDTLHPEKTLIVPPGNLLETPLPLRVGSEVEVELLTMRMPNPTSAVAVVQGRLIEVENAANFAGTSIGIRIIDIDDEGILAEPTITLKGAAPSKRRRRRKAKGPVSAAEQVEELRELAEEAARSLETQRSLAAARELQVGSANVHEPQIAHAAVQEGQIPHTGQPIAASQPFHPTPPGPRPFIAREPITPRRGRRRDGVPFGDSVSAVPRAAEFVDQTAATVPFAAQDDDAGTNETLPLGEAPRRRRRRRRRRGSGNGMIQQQSGAETVQGTSATERGSVPNRAIFRVDSHGMTEPTGELAPQEPSRALARWRPRTGDVAINPPPPSLSVPEPAPRMARPTRRRHPDDSVITNPQMELPRATMPALPTSAQHSQAPTPASGRRPLRPAAPIQAPPVATPLHREAHTSMPLTPPIVIPAASSVSTPFVQASSPVSASSAPESFPTPAPRRRRTTRAEEALATETPPPATRTKALKEAAVPRTRRASATPAAEAKIKEPKAASVPKTTAKAPAKRTATATARASKTTPTATTRKKPKST